MSKILRYTVIFALGVAVGFRCFFAYFDWHFSHNPYFFKLIIENKIKKLEASNEDK